MNTGTTRKRGDTAPPLLITCYDGDTPVDLSTATSARLIITDRAGTNVVDAAVTGDAAGQVAYTLPPTAVANVLRLYAEVEVTWPGGTIQTFPASGTLTIDVVADLG